MARLTLAALLGGAIGFERELHQKSAGLRTNILIALGSALFTIVSLSVAAPGDPSRIAAQVVTGIGFLGGGAILRTGRNIQGLTTAATIWVNAAVGMTAGMGRYGMATAATVVTLIVLTLGTRVERYVDRRWSSDGGASVSDPGAEPSRPA